MHSLTGGQLRWKDVDLGLRRSLPTHRVYQNHPVCLGVKRDQQRRRRCVAWCGVPGRSDEGLASCHAGLQQWRWPVHDTVGLMGHWCYGPFGRGRDDLPPPPSLESVAACRWLAIRAMQALSGSRRIALGRIDATELHSCLRAVVRLLAQEPRHGQSAAELARQVRISPSRLQHLCRESLGVSLLTLRDRHLLDHARRLLLDPAGLPVQRVAAHLGFRDQQAFATWFRRQTGDSPRVWRNRDAL